MRAREKGGSQLGAILWLVIFAAVAYAAWKVAPVYIDHYALVDKVNEIARSPRGGNPDEKLVDWIMKYVREERLDPYVQRSAFKVSTLDTNREISFAYERTVEVLPGFKYTFHFNDKVAQPLVF